MILRRSPVVFGSGLLSLWYCWDFVFTRGGAIDTHTLLAKKHRLFLIVRLFVMSWNNYILLVSNHRTKLSACTFTFSTRANGRLSSMFLVYSMYAPKLILRAAWAMTGWHTTRDPWPVRVHFAKPRLSALCLSTYDL